MKIKQKFEDFIVKEKYSLKIIPSGKIKLYSLTKTGLDLFYVLQDISKHNRIPLTKISFAGIKDKIGITTQYISIPNSYSIIPNPKENYQANFKGYIEKPIKRGGLYGNEFTITVRDLTKKDIDQVRANIKRVTELGVPNYFDSQRFGSYIENKFIIKDILKENISEAIKLYLTHKQSDDVPELKIYKKILAKKWNQLKALEAKNSHGRYIIEEFQKTDSWEKAFQKIPALERELFVTAYQSYIWNECIKVVLRQRIAKNNIFSVHYKAGMLTFFRALNLRPNQYIQSKFPTISEEWPKSPYAKKIQEKILKKEGLNYINFNIQEKTNNYFHSTNRDVLVFPKNLDCNKPERDEVNSKTNKEKLKLTLSFFLSKGSYATIVLKGLLEQ